MKLKQYLFIAASVLMSISASADIIRFIHNVNGQQEPEYKDFTSASVMRQLNYQRIWSEGRSIQLLAGSTVSQKIPAIYHSLYASQGDKIEILRPEKVRLEIDADAFPVMLTTDYEIILNGKVSLIDYSDEVISGTLATRDVLGRSCGTFKSENQGITYLDDEHTRMEYKLGGEFGREIEFQVLSSASELLSNWYYIDNITDANSFTDFANLCVNRYNWNFGTYKNPWWTVATTEDMTTVTENIEFWVNEYICHYGAKATFRVDEDLYVNGKHIPMSQLDDYVKFNPVLEINEETSPYSYLPLEFNLSALDLTKSNHLSMTLKLDSLELSSETPELVRKAVENGDIYPYCQIDLRTIVTINEVDRLTIDPAKVSFPDIEEREGSIAALFDDNPNTFCHSSWSTAKPRSEPYGSYMDIEFEEPIQELGFAMQTRHNSTPLAHPKSIRLYWSNDGETWNLLAEPEVSAPCNTFSTWIEEFSNPNDRFKAPGPFKYLRFCVIKNGMGEPLTHTYAQYYWNLAELHFYGK